MNVEISKLDSGLHSFNDKSGFLFWGPTITDDNVFLLIIECEFHCGCGGECMSCIVCHKVYAGQQNLEVGGMQVSVSGSSRTQRQNLTLQRHR